MWNLKEKKQKQIHRKGDQTCGYQRQRVRFVVTRGRGSDLWSPEAGGRREEPEECGQDTNFQL